MRPLFLAFACGALLINPSVALEGARYQITLHPVSRWAKTCSKATGKTACYVSRNFGTDSRKSPMLNLSISDIDGDRLHDARFLMPGGLRTDVGLSFDIDGGDKLPGRFEKCFQGTCFAEAKFGTAELTAMKKGGTMQITTADARNRRIDFYISLNGFAAAYDGAGHEAPQGPPPGMGPPVAPAVPRPGEVGI